MKRLPEGATGFATLETKTNFIATTDGGIILAHAKAIHLGRSTQTWDVEARSEKDDKTMALSLYADDSLAQAHAVNLNRGTHNV